MAHRDAASVPQSGPVQLPAVSFRILGPLDVTVGANRLAVGGNRQGALLATLLVQAPRLVPVNHLMNAMWDDNPPDSAKRLVQNAVSALRRAFVEAGATEPVILADGPSYRIDPRPGSLDAGAFTERVAAAGRLSAAGDAAGAFDELTAGLELWRGPALLGLTGRIVEAAAARLDEQRLTAAELRFDLALGLGRHDQIVGELADLVSTYPLRERLVGQLMLALHRVGRQAEAVYAYQRLRTELSESLGIDPGSAVQAVYAGILANEPGPTPPPPAPEKGPADPPARAVPAQLPADVGGFTGRAAQLRTLDEMLAADLAEPGAGILVAAIGGMAGIGKTALAVHWAHRAREHFPDGQLFINLSGHGPGEPMAPEAALAQLLHGLGVPADQIPADVQTAAGLYRTALAGRRVLVVLDNASDTQQVLPLLPGASGCLVLATSRDQLGGLAAAIGARLVALDVVSPVEARHILAHRVGTRRVNAEPDAVDRIVEQCARLPLALAIVAARAAARPGFSMAAIAAELGDVRDRLNALDAGIPAADLRAVLSWSYQRLDPANARLFRLLGLQAGPEIGVAAAASLAGTEIEPTRRALTDLARNTLISEPASGRFQYHDLLRAYSGELSDRLDPAEERRAAIHRLLDHYVRGALAASRLAEPTRSIVDDPAPVPGTVPVELADLASAFEWYGSERLTLLAAADLAVAHGFDEHAWKLGLALGPIHDRRGHFQDSIALQHVAIAAAHRDGKPAAEAVLHRTLANAYKDTRRFDVALRHADEAVALARLAGDRTEVAFAHLSAAGVFEAEGRYQEAVPHAESARALFHELDDPRREGFALSGLAHLYAQLGDHQRALECCDRALEPHRDLTGMGRSAVLDSRGVALAQLGEYDRAMDSYRMSLDVFRELDFPVYAAVVYEHMGDLQRALGDVASAQLHWHSALDVLSGVDPSAGPAESIRAKLAQLQPTAR